MIAPGEYRIEYYRKNGELIKTEPVATSACLAVRQAQENSADIDGAESWAVLRCVHNSVDGW